MVDYKSNFFALVMIKFLVVIKFVIKKINKGDENEKSF